MGRAGTFRTPGPRLGGPRVWMGRFPQAIPFRKTPTTDKPVYRLGTVVTRLG
jgi:hypothetical protein